MGIRITSWNVNGIRNPFSYQPWRENKTFQSMFDTLEADIVVMQETKIQRKDLQDDMVLVPGWDVYFSLPKVKKGYSGVAIYTRNSKCCPIRAEEGITGILCPPNSTTKFRELPDGQQIGGYPRPEQLSGAIDEATLDSEGRCVILEFPAFVLIGVYSPATRDDTRTDFRLAFIEAMDARVRNLVAMGKQVILTGDLNIIRSELDTAGIQERLRKEGMSMDDFFSMPSRRFLNQLVFGGTVIGERDEGREAPVMWDLGREFHPTRLGMYTCWETRKNARPGNFGSRIDYVLCSAGIRDWFVDSNIQEGLLGSDHCPVYASMGDVVNSDGRNVHLLDVMNPDGMVVEGKRRREWSARDLLPLSAKLIPDFDRRRSIRDMFTKKVAPAVHKKESSTISEQNTSDSTDSKPLSPSRLTSESADALSQKSFPSWISTSPKTRLPKRPSDTPVSSRPHKRTKPPENKDISHTCPGRSQTSLRGFFKPKESTPPAFNTHMAPKHISPYKESQSAATDDHPFVVKSSREKKHDKESESNSSSGNDKRGGRDGGASSQDTEKVFDPIQSKESWSKLLGKRVVPKCEHDEPCISLVTKKPGVNCGRSFYMCGRPLGPSGEKEKGTEWRCGTFIWSSDWSSAQ